MNDYTAKELESLLEILELAKIQSGAVDSPDSALLNTAGILIGYRKEGPNKIRSKICEFADIGKLAQYCPVHMEKHTQSCPLHPYHQVYLLLYEYPIEEVPKYLDTPYEVLAIWRLSLSRKFLV
jgi:hypothetical protein